MIVDRIENAGLYFRNGALDKAFDFIKSLKPDVAEGKYQIDGANIYAMVSSYDAKPFESCIMEAHRKYIDIQCVLSGSELLGWASIKDLAIKTPYNSDNDAEFYVVPDSHMPKIELSAGLFVFLLPEDAHMPGIRIENKNAKVKKTVIKVKYDYWNKSF